jgi:hypothetical protein
MKGQGRVLCALRHCLASAHAQRLALWHLCLHSAPPPPQMQASNVCLAPSRLLLQSWGDVYFFCGRQYEYCSPAFRWNRKGWAKALVLWNLALSSALAVQKLIIVLGLGGLLPGEEVVTKEVGGGGV